MEPKLFLATKAFVVHNGKILIIRESNANPVGTNAGKFDVPGGRLYPGERYADALLREIKEETGLQASVGRPFFVGEWRPVVRGEQWQIVGVYFECSSDSDAVTLSEEHDAYEWIKPQTFHAYPLIDNVTLAFEAYLAQR